LVCFRLFIDRSNILRIRFNSNCRDPSLMSVLLTKIFGNGNGIGHEM
jgi:hypothetical protein